MTAPPGRKDEIPSPDELVSFSVLCQPRGGQGFDELIKGLTLENLAEYQPTDEVRVGVVASLRTLGFKVLDPDSPVSARGTVRLFEAVFGVPLVKRRYTREGPRGSSTFTAIVPAEGIDENGIVTDKIPGALRIVVAMPPLLTVPRLPPPIRNAAFALRVPGDLAQLTGASAAHRRKIGSKSGASGHGIGVAIVDTGFALHPYFDDHGYHIHRVAAPGTSNPEIDDEPHGTGVLAALLACAPDAKAHAVKFGPDLALAFKFAAKRKGVRVISLSWAYDLAGSTTLSALAVALNLPILDAIQKGKVVVAAAGDGQQAFPAMMPEVIAVGGIDIDAADALTQWPLSSYFTSAIYPARPVPDLCALAGDMILPVPPPPDDWLTYAGGTSTAAPQVAAAAALLLQKKPSLTPSQVRNALVNQAKPVPGSMTTGAGLLDALAALQAV